MSVLVRNSAGGGGYDFTARINVTYPSEAVVTCSLGDRTYTDSSHTGSHKFRIHKAGTWIVKAVSGSKESTREVIIETNGQVVNIDLAFSQIFGITRDITKSSPAWARTDRAVGMTATASVGTVAGHSDFDNYMPWSGIKRETLSTGDVMVKIPKFWYQRYITGGIETIKIASAPVEGFAVHPAFNHGGVEKDCIYVGAYKMSYNNSLFYSKSGEYPDVNVTRGVGRNTARKKGAGWGIIDISTLSAIQMLILVEFATNGVQDVIGEGLIGAGNRQRTGSCDNIPNLTGRFYGDFGKKDVVYRGIEGLWGNVREYVDGVNYDGTRYYVCNNPDRYKDDTKDGYEALPFSSAGQDGYITNMGCDAGTNNHIMLPTNAGNGGSNLYYCDYTYSTVYDWAVLASGGHFYEGVLAGLFFSKLNGSSGTTDSNTSSRLVYIPQ